MKTNSTPVFFVPLVNQRLLQWITTLTFFALLSTGVHADTRTWTGGGDPDMEWTNALNWLEGTPPPNPLPFTVNTADGAITFSGAPANLNSIVSSNWSVGRLVFPVGTGNYVLSGADLVLEQGQSGNANYSIHHQNGANTASITFNNNIVFTTNAGPANLRRQVVVDSTTGVLTFNGNIIKSNLGLAEIYFRGNGIEIVNGALLWDTNRILKTDNSLLILNNSGNVWTQLVLSVGTVRLGVDNALPVTSSVDFNQSAVVTLDLSNRNQTISFLRNSAVGGTQTINTGTGAGGTLTLNDNGVTNVVAVVIAGTGRLIKNGNGTLTLSGNSTYTGGTAINAGILQLGNNGTAGSVVGNVTNNAALVLSRTDSSTLAANISGSGPLLKLGTGTVILSGNNTYSGSTTISNGMLAVNSTLNNSSSVTVHGGALGGNGTVGTPVVAANAGQVLPGTPVLPGTLTVSNLTVNSGGSIGAKLNTTTTVGGGVNDLLVTDNLVLDAGSVLTVSAVGNLVSGGTYVVATYNSLTGTFGSISNLTHYTLTLDYSVANQIRVSVSGTTPNLVWSPSGSVTWDLTSSNWLNSAVRDRFYQGDSVTFDNTPTNFAPSMTTVLTPGVVTVNSSSNYTFAGAGRLSGLTSISKSGTGQLLINNAHDYVGQVTVSGGILRAGNAAALGATNGNTVVNGGTYDVGGQNVGFETLVVQGDGVNGTNGAINNAGGQQQSALRYVTLIGDATFNASGQRWDMHNTGLTGAQLQGNGFKLTKRGAFDVWIKDVGDTGLGDIDVRQATLGFQGAPMGMGNSAATMTVFQGGTFGMWDVRSNLLNKNLVLTNGNVFAGGSSNNFIGPITLQGTNTIITDVPLRLPGVISGPGGFNKNNGSILYLEGANTFSGPTLLNTGQIVVGPSSSLGNSSLILLATGTTLDVSAAAKGLTLGAGQTLAGRGTIVGLVTNNTGSFLSPGTSVGTLTVNGDLTLNNATNVVELGSDPFTVGGSVNDLVTVNGSVNLSGLNTIKIVPVAPLSAATPYIIVNTFAVNGTAANLQVTSDNPRYTLSVLDPVTTPGQIQISVTGNPTPLVWKGGKAPNPIAWDHTVTNWLNTGTAQFDKFFDGDLVTFDDSAATNLVSVTETNVAGLAVFTNNTLDYTLTGAGAIGGTFVTDGSGTVTFAFSNPGALGLTYLTNNSGTLAFNMSNNATMNALIADANGIGGAILKLGTNQLNLGGDNSLYNGPITVSGGTLAATANNALGSVFGNTVVSSGARLLLVGAVTVPEPLTLNAAFDGVGGALQAAGTASTAIASGAITLASATRVAADTGCTLRFQGGIAGNAGLTVGGPGNTVIEFGNLDGLTTNSLTKVDAGLLGIAADSTVYDGPVFVNGGILRVSSGFALGSSVGATTVQTNTTLDFFFNAPTVDEPITIVGTGTANQGAIHTGGGGGCTPILLGPITLSGDALIKMDGSTILSLSNSVTGNANLGVTIDGNGPCIIEGNVSLGAHSLTKASSGQLVLRGAANAWSGPTIIVSGSIALGTGSSLGTSSFVAVGTNQAALLDATIPGLSFGAGQTLAGLGTVRGDTTFGSGATLSAGYNGVGTLTFNTNTLTLGAGSTNAVDFIKSGTVTCDTIANLTTVNMGGTLVLNDLGVNPLAGGDQLKLFNASAYNGSFANIVPATPGSGLVWDTSTLNADGTLRVASVAVPQFGNVFLVGTNFLLTGSGGTAGGNYSVLSHTNINSPLTNWSLVGSGSFDLSGNFAFTNGITPGEPTRFYLIRIP